MSTEERRHFSRIHFDSPARCVTVDRQANAKVLDLSLQGALLEWPDEALPPLGEPCLLAVPLGDSRITMVAEVAHVQGQQVGLQCRSIDLESITLLRRLVEMHLGSSQLLERELKALVAG